MIKQVKNIKIVRTQHLNQKMKSGGSRFKVVNIMDNKQKT